MRKFALLAAMSVALMAGTAAFAADEPRSGGVINFVAPYGDSFSTLDVQASPATQDEFYAKAIHRTLYDWDADLNKPVLGLATDVSVSEDRLVYTYKLRQDAFFHDGKPLTADDIIWSYTRIMDPKKGIPTSSLYCRNQGC